MIKFIHPIVQPISHPILHPILHPIVHPIVYPIVHIGRHTYLLSVACTEYDEVYTFNFAVNKHIRTPHKKALQTRKKERKQGLNWTIQYRENCLPNMQNVGVKELVNLMTTKTLGTSLLGSKTFQATLPRDHSKSSPEHPAATTYNPEKKSNSYNEGLDGTEIKILKAK